MKKLRLTYSFFTPAIAVFLILLFAGCGSSDEPKVEKASYEDWVDYNAGKFRFHFSPKSRWLADHTDLTDGYNRFLAGICDMLEVQLPQDTIDLYIYGPGLEMQDITGQMEPFHTEHAIHWGGHTPYGYQLTKFVLDRSGIKPGQFKVVNEGLPHLLDYSSINYHDKLNRIYNSGMFIKLLDLGDNEKLDSLSHFIKRSESASLTGFIMYNYGLDRLFMLWKSSVDWRRSIETIFQLPIDEFESSWLDFARENAIDPEGTVEDDTTQMYRTVVE